MSRARAPFDLRRPRRRLTPKVTARPVRAGFALRRTRVFAEVLLRVIGVVSRGLR
jgi:hypothetical protein